MIKTSMMMLALSYPFLADSQQEQNKIAYPHTKQTATVDFYFGTPVSDPYRWFEDDRSEETSQWIQTQNELTFAYLEQIPFRNQIKTQLEDRWNYEKISAPFIQGDYTYYYKNNGLQDQAVLYRKDKTGEEEIFLDPNTFSSDGTTALSEISFSKNNELAAYQISQGGSDWRKVIVIEVESKKIVEDTLIDVKFSTIAWQGNDGFYYSSYDKPKGSELSEKTDQHKLYFHQIGTPQKHDKVIFGDKHKRRYIGAHVTEDNRFLVITAANSTYGNELYICDLFKGNGQIHSIVDNFDHQHVLIDNQEDTLFILTDKDAPNKKVVAVHLNDLSQWNDRIAETQHVLSISTCSGYFFAHYIKDALSEVKQFDYSGNFIRTIALPGIGSVHGFYGRKEDKRTYYLFTNYTTATTIYSFDPSDGHTTLYQQPKIKFQSQDYESRQVFYTSKDGTKIPMIISYKKGTVLNGKNPTILYGYGGFNISLTPSFSIANAVWMENGGVYAVANLRGGGEYGKKWHEAGTQLQKQNVFDDFIAAAEYLIQENYTSSNYLAIRGGSNGGLLVGACMTQRPELFRVALPAVGVLDMLRYHTFTAGAGWAYDYGTAEQSKKMFDYLKSYSPIHNVKPAIEYPATLITTADHDDRVVPAHSFKFAAELQNKQRGNNPVLIRVDIDAGHGAGKSLSKTIEETADIQAFTLYNMGIKTLNTPEVQKH